MLTNQMTRENLEYTKALTLDCGISGRRYRSCNWGNPVCSSVYG